MNYSIFQIFLLSADVNASTVMVLLNAVYFKGSWKNKFQESNTELKPFHVNKTTTVDVPTMYLKEKFYYKELKDINADVIGIPYVVSFGIGIEILFFRRLKLIP